MSVSEFLSLYAELAVVALLPAVLYRCHGGVSLALAIRQEGAHAGMPNRWAAAWPTLAIAAYALAAWPLGAGRTFYNLLR